MELSAPTSGDLVEVNVLVNGMPCKVAVSAEDSAVELLREGLQLTGTKLVCGEGVCGACTVLVDGIPMNSCVLAATALDGRSVTTIEGVGAPLHPVQQAFIAHDALQCGYCTPGFVMEAIAFYDCWRAKHGTKQPTRAEVVEGLSGHLCRCGAYVGIIVALRAACEGRFDHPVAYGPRMEAVDKVTGRALFTTDVRERGQLEGVILRSPHPHARVVSVDLSAASALPGVAAAVQLLPDGAKVRYVGQEVAAVAAIDRRTAKHALALIRVVYEPLPAAVGVDAAKARGAPRVHPRFSLSAPRAAEGPRVPARWRGNVHDTFDGLSFKAGKARKLIAAARTRQDPLLIEKRWQADVQIHTAFEPHACVACWSGDALVVYASTQAAAYVSQRIAKHLGMAKEKVRVIAEHVGGGFGAKLDLSAEAIAAIELARVARASVRVVLDRQEEMTVGGYRPGARIHLALLARPSRLEALQVAAYADAGVAVGSQIALLARMIYPAAAKALSDFSVASHQPPGKPFRGPSGPVTAWALEQAVDEAAARLGLDPIALRRRWDPDPLRGRLYDWAENLVLWRNRPAPGSERGRYRRGVGAAAANWIYFFQKDCEVEVGVDKGRIYVATAVQDVGTGIRSVLADAVARTLGLPPTQVDVRLGDTQLAKGPISSASRSTATLVPSAVQAALRLRTKLERRSLSWKLAPDQIGSLHARSGRPRDVRRASSAARPLAGTGFFGLLTRAGFNFFLKLGVGRGYTGAVHVTEVEVDTRLGTTRVLNVAAGLAAGRLAAPELARSQCYGGIIQGIGYALYEHREVDPSSGVVLTSGLEDYRIPGIGDVPEIELHFDQRGFAHAAGASVGLGELSTLGVAASIGNAVHNATGWRPLHLPIRPDRLLEGTTR
jgi:xanthine dehydrogenase YagR molybdenum-binding subunit